MGRVVTPGRQPFHSCEAAHEGMSTSLTHTDQSTTEHAANPASGRRSRRLLSAWAVALASAAASAAGA